MTEAAPSPRMAGPSSCPAYLVARLEAIHAHVLHLASGVGAPGVPDEQVDKLVDDARRAIAARSTALVQDSLRAHREIAQRLYSSQRESEPVEDRSDGSRRGLAP